MNRSQPLKTLIALFTVATFLTTSVIWAPDSFAAAQAIRVPAPAALEVPIPYQARLDPGIQFSIPQELGTLQYFKAGKGPMVVHLQTAHGHYQAQKQIQAILHHLDKQYGIRTILVEGSAFKLEPEILSFFPKDPALTQKVNDALTKAALVKGPELYLLDKLGETSRPEQAAAYGIENLKAYRENGIAFVNVLTEKKKTENFLAAMNDGIDRLAAAYLNDALRGYLKRLESFEKGQMPLEAWLSSLKQEVLKRLKLDLTQPGAQLDWPMLVRIFKVQELSAKFDKDAFAKERVEFLKVLRRFLLSSHSQIEQLLKSEQVSQQLPALETGLLFEDMVKALPRDFNYKAFPNVCYFIGRLLLQSELKAPELIQETERLSSEVADKLAKTKVEKELVALLKDYRLLQKLFALELTPADHEQILSRNEKGLKPSSIIKRLQGFERSASSVARVKDVHFVHIADLDQLFNAAIQFYAGVKERDGLMEQMIEKRLQETGADKVAVITGGFHSEPFKNYFASKDYSYVLISPRITNGDEAGHQAYVENMLRFSKGVRRTAYGEKKSAPSSSSQNAATRELEFLSDPQVLSGNSYDVNAATVRSEVRKIVSTVAGRTATSQTVDLNLQPTAETRSEARVSSNAVVQALVSRSGLKGTAQEKFRAFLKQGRSFALRAADRQPFTFFSQHFPGDSAQTIWVYSQKDSDQPIGHVDFTLRKGDRAAIVSYAHGYNPASRESSAAGRDAIRVDEAYRSRNIGSNLLLLAMYQAKALGYQSFYIVSGDPSGNSLYAKLGFVLEGGAVQKFDLVHQPLPALPVILSSGKVRSESRGLLAEKSRLTPAQEKQFQKAMSDLQPKWWDGWLNNDGVDRRVAVAKTLGEIKRSPAIPALVGMLKSESYRVRGAAITALYNTDVWHELDSELNSPYLDVRIAVAVSRWKHHDVSGISDLVGELRHRTSTQPPHEVIDPPKSAVDALVGMFNSINDPGRISDLERILRIMPSTLTYGVSEDQLETRGSGDTERIYFSGTAYTGTEIKPNPAYKALLSAITRLKAHEQGTVTKEGTDTRSEVREEKTTDDRLPSTISSLPSEKSGLETKDERLMARIAAKVSSLRSRVTPHSGVAKKSILVALVLSLPFAIPLAIGYGILRFFQKRFRERGTVEEDEFARAFVDELIENSRQARKNFEAEQIDLAADIKRFVFSRMKVERLAPVQIAAVRAELDGRLQRLLTGIAKVGGSENLLSKDAQIVVNARLGEIEDATNDFEAALNFRSEVRGLPGEWQVKLSPGNAQVLKGLENAFSLAEEPMSKIPELRPFLGSLRGGFYNTIGGVFLFVEESEKGNFLADQEFFVKMLGKIITDFEDGTRLLDMLLDGPFEISPQFDAALKAAMEKNYSRISGELSRLIRDPKQRELLRGSHRIQVQEVRNLLATAKTTVERVARDLPSRSEVRTGVLGSRIANWLRRLTLLGRSFPSAAQLSTTQGVFTRRRVMLAGMFCVAAFAGLGCGGGGGGNAGPSSAEVLPEPVADPVGEWSMVQNGDEYKLLFGDAQYASILKNGYIRLTLTPGQHVGWGTSFVTPSYWTGSHYYHNMRIENINIQPSEDGTMVLTGRLESEHLFANNFRLVFGRPRGDHTFMDGSYTLQAKSPVSFDVTDHPYEYLKGPQFSSMNVGSAKDFDQLFTSNGQYSIQNRTGALNPSPQWDSPSVTAALVNTTRGPSSFGELKPTAYIQVGGAPGQVAVQGWLQQESDPNADNVGAWFAMQSLGYVSFRAGVVPPGAFSLRPEMSPPAPVTQPLEPQLPTHTPAELAGLPGSPDKTVVYAPGAFATAIKTDRGIYITFDTGSAGWSGGGFTYDDFSTTAIETSDLSSLNNMRFEIHGQIPPVALIKMEVVDADDRKATVYLDKITAEEGKVWRIPRAAIDQYGPVDMSRIRLIYFIVEGNGTGFLYVNDKPPRSEVRQGARQIKLLPENVQALSEIKNEFLFAVKKMGIGALTPFAESLRNGFQNTAFGVFMAADAIKREGFLMDREIVLLGAIAAELEDGIRLLDMLLDGGLKISPQFDEALKEAEEKSFSGVPGELSRLIRDPKQRKLLRGSHRIQVQEARTLLATAKAKIEGAVHDPSLRQELDARIATRSARSEVRKKHGKQIEGLAGENVIDEIVGSLRDYVASEEMDEEARLEAQGRIAELRHIMRGDGTEREIESAIKGSWRSSGTRSEMRGGAGEERLVAAIEDGMRKIETLRRANSSRGQGLVQKLQQGVIQELQADIISYQRALLYIGGIGHEVELPAILAMAPIQTVYDVYRAASKVSLPAPAMNILPQDMVRFFYGVVPQGQEAMMQRPEFQTYKTLVAQEMPTSEDRGRLLPEMIADTQREAFARAYAPQLRFIEQMALWLPFSEVQKMLSEGRPLANGVAPLRTVAERVSPAKRADAKEQLQTALLAVFLKNLVMSNVENRQTTAASKFGILISEARLLRENLAVLRSEVRKNEFRFYAAATQKGKGHEAVPGIVAVYREGGRIVGTFSVPATQEAGRKTYAIEFLDNGKGTSFFHERTVQFAVTIDERGILREVGDVEAKIREGVATPHELNAIDKRLIEALPKELKAFLVSKIGQPWGPDLFRANVTATAIQEQNGVRTVSGVNVPEAARTVSGEMADETPGFSISWSRKELKGLTPDMARALQYWTPVLYTRRPLDMGRTMDNRAMWQKHQISHELPVAAQFLKKMALELTREEISRLTVRDFSEVVSTLQQAVADGRSLQRAGRAPRGPKSYDQLEVLANSPDLLKIVLNKVKTIYEAEIQETKATSTETPTPRRSELRLTDFADVVTPEKITLIEYFYFNILPAQLRELIEGAGGREAVLEALRKIPGIIASEAAVDIPETSVLDGLFAPEVSLSIPETAGKGLAVEKTVTPTVKNLGGKVFLGQDILTRLMTENPRALFYLLKTYAVFVEHNESPVLLTVGSPDLISQIKDALINRNSGLRGFEISERAALLEALEAGKILEVIESVQGASEAQIISREAAKTGGGIASLHLNAAMIPGSTKGVHFAFGENVGARDLMVASVFAIVLKSAADLIYNIPDANARAELLSKFFEENLPGVQMRKQGSNSFVITQITMLAQEFAARAYIATRA